LMNLCINTRDAMSHRGIIRLSAENIRIDKTDVRMNLDAQAGAYVALTV
jgi:hypothetical protein